MKGQGLALVIGFLVAGIGLAISGTKDSSVIVDLRAHRGEIRAALSHPKLQPPKRKEDQTFRFSAAIWHAYSSLCAREKIKLRNREGGGQRSEIRRSEVRDQGSPAFTYCGAAGRGPVVEKLLRLTGCMFLS
jgi:hypothetical protein